MNTSTANVDVVLVSGALSAWWFAVVVFAALESEAYAARVANGKVLANNGDDHQWKVRRGQVLGLFWIVVVASGIVFAAALCWLLVTVGALYFEPDALKGTSGKLSMEMPLWVFAVVWAGRLILKCQTLVFDVYIQLRDAGIRERKAQSHTTADDLAANKPEESARILVLLAISAVVSAGLPYLGWLGYPVAATIATSWACFLFWPSTFKSMNAALARRRIALLLPSIFGFLALVASLVPALMVQMLSRPDIGKTSTPGQGLLVAAALFAGISASAYLITTQSARGHQLLGWAYFILQCALIPVLYSQGHALWLGLGPPSAYALFSLLPYPTAILALVVEVYILRRPGRGHIKGSSAAPVAT